MRLITFWPLWPHGKLAYICELHINLILRIWFIVPDILFVFYSFSMSGGRWVKQFALYDACTFWWAKSKFETIRPRVKPLYSHSSINRNRVTQTMLIQIHSTRIFLQQALLICFTSLFRCLFYTSSIVLKLKFVLKLFWIFFQFWCILYCIRVFCNCCIRLPAMLNIHRQSIVFKSSLLLLLLHISCK